MDGEGSIGEVALEGYKSMKKGRMKYEVRF